MPSASVPSPMCIEKVGMWGGPSGPRATPSSASRSGGDAGVGPTAKYVASFRDMTLEALQKRIPRSLAANRGIRPVARNHSRRIL